MIYKWLMIHPNWLPLAWSRSVKSLRGCVGAARRGRRNSVIAGPLNGNL